MPPSQSAAFAKTYPSQPSADIEWARELLSLAQVRRSLHAFPAITPSVSQLAPDVAAAMQPHHRA